MARKKIVAGNWKMNMTPSQAVKLVEELKPLVVSDDVEVVYCVPAIDIVPVVEAVKGTNVAVGAAVIVVMVIATAVTFPLQIFLLDAYNLGYLQTIIFILVIAVLVQLIEITLKKYVPALYQSLGVYLPLITTNCCVLGVTILAVQDYSAVVAEFGFGLAYAEALVCAAGAGVGFLVAMLLFCGVRSRVEAANPPESFKGLPITLVSAAITSMSFMGFGGLVENIINAIF